jgi:ABC-2 type transport system permease protein
MNPIALYFRYIGLSLRGQMQYRGAFVMQSVGHLLVTAIEFLGIWALFHRFGNLRGWSMPEVAMLYGMISMIFATADALAKGFDMFGDIVKAGDFDRLLVRPRSTVLQLLGQELTLKRVGRFLQGLVVFVWAIIALHIDWSFAKISLLLAAFVGGVCLFIGIVIIQATITFWTTETLEMMNAFTYGGEYAAEYPLAIYRGWFRKFFLFVVPLGCANYLPALAIIGRHDPIGTPPVLQWLSPLAGVLFLTIALQLWKVGVRHYTSTGS